VHKKVGPGEINPVRILTIIFISNSKRPILVTTKNKKLIAIDRASQSMRSFYHADTIISLVQEKETIFCYSLMETITSAIDAFSIAIRAVSIFHALQRPCGDRRVVNVKRTVALMVFGLY
jgi:hypothetical protein